MPKNLVSEDYYRVSRELLPEMDTALREAVEALLRRAENGEKVDNRLVEIITEDKVLRQKFREALHMGIDKTMGVDYSHLAGDVNSPAARKYICPVPGHNYINRIQKVGEDPGICPIHKVVLVPIEQKEGK